MHVNIRVNSIRNRWRRGKSPDEGQIRNEKMSRRRPRDSQFEFYISRQWRLTRNGGFLAKLAVNIICLHLLKSIRRAETLFVGMAITGRKFDMTSPACLESRQELPRFNGKSARNTFQELFGDLGLKPTSFFFNEKFLTCFSELAFLSLPL